MNLDENIETDSSGLITGSSTGRLIASFSHVDEAEAFVEMVNTHAPIDNCIEELDSLCRKYNSGNMNLSQLVCSVWNTGVFVGSKENNHLKDGVNSASERLKELSAEDRMELFSMFCKECGSDDPKCRCWDDS
jgi:hypothetical protein